MKELFNISPHSTGDGFTMSLKTGTIDVPDEYGGYIISRVWEPERQNQ